MPDEPQPVSGGVPTGSYAALLDASGTVVRSHSFGYHPDNAPSPCCPPASPGRRPAASAR